MIAALFVETGGCYYNLPYVDPWDIHRDARKYNGPHPIVAHPPCQLWGPFAAINYKRWGGEHNRPGNDGGCFASSIAHLMRCGGVIEHPARSKAWAHYGIKRPTTVGWNVLALGYWICEVWQSAYGHQANKATWLLYHGDRDPFDLDWSRPQGAYQIGRQDQRGKDRNKPTVIGRAASATPTAFRDVLIRLAEHSRAGVLNGGEETVEATGPAGGTVRTGRLG
jgi:hypothetical protein